MSRTFIRPAMGRMSSPMNLNRKHPVSGQVRPHWGMDIAKPGRVKIKAAADGVVRARYRDGQFGGLGNCLFITHSIGGKTYETAYGHLASFSVLQGQKVKKGQVIGWMGNTGNSTGQHLHFEIHSGRWSNTYKGALNPQKYVSAADVPQFGYEGEVVKDIQQKLKDLGYLKDKVDGIWGQKTEDAVRDFQKAEKLDVDGYVGPNTMKKLGGAKKKTENSDISYKVKSGDTLSEIAKKHKTTVSKLMKDNPKIKDKNVIRVGQTIKIKK